MQTRHLSVHGAFEFTPKIFPDDRGLFVSPFQQAAFGEATGRAGIPVAQSNHSRSRRGVVRGVHYTVTPPGTAKYVYCPRGRSLDIVVDIRVGSPTYGKWDAVVLDQIDFRSLYLPVGVGHAFVALEDETVMSYLLTSPYVAEYELSVSALDPALGLPLPPELVPVQSDRDSAAMTLDEARQQGLLPDYETCLRVEKALWPV
ncbi:dTDP-4-dehydrorhamnose 3,5-epimerase family protein [Micromonospora sp. NPDC048871]|uniref:dTDP-4-dehydrorhamnose 3,5-epimerase family protein n=1 Tax=unclassified Micromonospora TaxID=2617518 RepID=UPI002E14ACCB|nr:dTDP-4-dehydrorhamnose 3,5-epimerase [Micromonospora sp. NBC_01739]